LHYGHLFALAFLIARRRHYFLKHLADVVNSGAKRKRDPDVPEKGIQPNHHKQRSGKVARVTKRLNPLTPRTIQKAEDGESRSTSSPDYISGMSHNHCEKLYVWSISCWDFRNNRPSDSHPPLAESPAVQTSQPTLWSRTKALPEAPRKTLAHCD